MSKVLRDSLRTMKQIEEAPNAAPVTYLHDPDTGRAFAALVSLDLVDKIPEADWDRINHDHRESDEDED
jgi:hypothetical protein